MFLRKSNAFVIRFIFASKHDGVTKSAGRLNRQWVLPGVLPIFCAVRRPFAYEVPYALVYTVDYCLKLSPVHNCLRRRIIFSSRTSVLLPLVNRRDLTAYIIDDIRLCTWTP